MGDTAASTTKLNRSFTALSLYETADQEEGDADKVLSEPMGPLLRFHSHYVEGEFTAHRFVSSISLWFTFSAFWGFFAVAVTFWLGGALGKEGNDYRRDLGWDTSSWGTGVGLHARLAYLAVALMVAL